MEFEGRIIRVLPVRSGTSQRGKWNALPFVFEYFESQDQRWSDKVLLETFDTNIMAQIGAYLKKGADGKAVVENGECVMLGELKCKCGFSHSVRTFDRQDGTKATINDLRMYKFEVITQGAVAQPHAQQPAYQPQLQMLFGTTQQGGGETDDLPF
jgi:hypothetical protein